MDVVFAAGQLPFTPSGWIAPTVSAAAGAGCLVGFLSTWIFGDRSIPRVSLALLLGAMTGLLTAAAAHPVRRVAEMLARLLQSVSVYALGVGVLGVLAAVPVIYVGVKVWKRDITDKTMIIAGTIPILLPFIPGVVGQIASFATYLPANFVGWIMAKFFGFF